VAKAEASVEELVSMIERGELPTDRIQAARGDVDSGGGGGADTAGDDSSGMGGVPRPAGAEDQENGGTGGTGGGNALLGEFLGQPRGVGRRNSRRKRGGTDSKTSVPGSSGVTGSGTGDVPATDSGRGSADRARSEGSNPGGTVDLSGGAGGGTNNVSASDAGTNAKIMSFVKGMLDILGPGSG